MVVGNGLIASAFAEFQQKDDYLIFASGVSNSLETKPAAFKREFDLLKEHIDTEACFVYFSTISLADESRADSPYRKHKLEVERFIKETAREFVIFRLPIVVGRSDNPHTLMNFLYNSILNQDKIKVFKNAARYLIDIDDIQQLLSSFLLTEFMRNTVVNVVFNEGIKVTDLVNLFEAVTQKKANATYVDVGTRFTVNNETLKQFLAHLGYDIPADYAQQLVNKYYGA